MAESKVGKGLPGTFKAFVGKYPALGRAHEEVARAVEAAGPLGKKELALVKIGIALGAGLESAVKSHVRRARQAGATAEEVEQAILLGMNTVGFPRTVAAWSWAQEQFARDAGETKAAPES
jgi:AhpD family alkylhydroperoxidase